MVFRRMVGWWLALENALTNSVPIPFKKGSRDAGIKTVLSIHWKPKSIWTIFLLNFGAVVLLRGQHFNSFNLKHRI